MSADPAPTPPLRIRRTGEATLPHRAHADDAGLDLASAEDLVIPAGGRALVDTGLALALPPGTVGMVCPRSGLAAKHGVTVLNGPGIVDAGYRGPVKVALHNTDPTTDFALHVGDRIAQLVVVPFLAPALVEVEDLEETERSSAGFGSSGGFGGAHHQEG
jgi:dUTP pyrophosphatase